MNACHTLNKLTSLALLCVVALALGLAPFPVRADDGSRPVERRLYVAEPGIRDYLEYGGHGLLVFDIDHGHRFVKRIPTAGLDAKGKPLNVKGICASAATKRIYISTIKQLMCLDLVTEKLLWEKTYDQGCDRMAITPDGSAHLPAVVRRPALVCRARRRRRGDRADHARLGLAQHGRRPERQGSLSRRLEVAVLDGRRHPDASGDPHGRPVQREHPAVHGQRPPDALLRERQRAARLRGRRPDVGTRSCYRVEVQGFEKGPTKRHGCPSHGIGLTPDEKELWLTDAFNSRMHIFDATVMPPKQVAVDRSCATSRAGSPSASTASTPIRRRAT